MAALNATTGHDHSSTSNKGPNIPGSSLTSLSTTSAGAGVIPAANLTSVAQKGANSDITSLTGLTGDVYNVAWTDYSSTSTITGWSSYTTKSIYYKKIGHLVFVSFKLDGTSNATTASFTVPYSAVATDVGSSSLGYTVNNGTQETNGTISISGSTIAIARNPGSSAWTNTGTKHVQGHFWFEATT